ASFWIFGSHGISCAVLWWRCCRDDPRKHPAVNADKHHVIEQGRGGAITHREFNWRLFLNADLLFICLTYFAFGYGLDFYLAWLQTYLREARGFSVGQASLLASIVLLSGAMARVIGGFWSGRWVDRYGP